MTDEFTLGGVRCRVLQYGEGGPAVFLGTFPEELPAVSDALIETLPDRNFLLAVFVTDDWNRDLSPWPAPPAFGTEDFGGGGPDTLAWLTEVYLPYIEEHYGPREEHILAGYSLAGLFSLWAAYHTAVFSGIACCSGSLWFEGWDGYAGTHALAGPCDVYLSLGGKEEKTKNARMATVGDRTRAQEKLLRADPNCRSVTLEWNPGGHFADPGKRLAKGLAWLLGRKRS